MYTTTRQTGSPLPALACLIFQYMKKNKDLCGKRLRWRKEKVMVFRVPVENYTQLTLAVQTELPEVNCAR